ncbi:MAG TPA: hypothetical protein PLR71_12275 [Deltaproteobacteria bacterium]|nr:hypothetical protein [Deltaproteobacteria bacterium]
MVDRDPSPYDDLTARCPTLGHLVPFTYCMGPASPLPCRKILDCWHERIDIVAYLQGVFSPAEMRSILAPPKPKVCQLMELIQNAQRRKKE